MANIKISALSAGTTLAGTEKIPEVQGGSTVYVTPDQINTYARTNVYREVWIGAGAMISRTSNGAATATVELSTNKNNFDAFDFDASAAEYTQFAFAFPDVWDRSTIKVKFIWTAASGSGDVIWGIQAVATSNDDAMDVAFGTAQTVTDTLITANDNHTTSATAALTVGGTPALGDLVYFQVYRDATAGGDTLAVDARLLGVHIQYKELTTLSAAW